MGNPFIKKGKKEALAELSQKKPGVMRGGMEREESANEEKEQPVRVERRTVHIDGSKREEEIVIFHRYHQMAMQPEDFQELMVQSLMKLNPTDVLHLLWEVHGREHKAQEAEISMELMKISGQLPDGLKAIIEQARKGTA